MEVARSKDATRGLPHGRLDSRRVACMRVRFMRRGGGHVRVSEAPISVAR